MLIHTSLPSALKAALERILHGLSRKDIATRATAISENYRSGGNSAIIRDASDALAYALARMPATYAADTTCLQETADRRPHSAPTSLLDVGAGPGTATWAAAEVFPALTSFVQIDSNTALRALALELVLGNERFTELRHATGDVRKGLAATTNADLVVASYVLGELAESERVGVIDALWARTRDILLVVEPGTPAGYTRIMELRRQLIAAGARVIAPCPHDYACPLSSPDWCHFSQRLARSRDHKQMKGAELPFEDEKFAYVALARTAAAHRPPARVLSQPVVTKVDVTAKLCEAHGGVTLSKTPRRDKDAYSRAKRWRWGDVVADH